MQALRRNPQNVPSGLSYPEDAQFVHLVMELCTGGELLDKLVEELLSVDAAREQYGVVIDSDRFVVDEVATEKLRVKLASEEVSPRT